VVRSGARILEFFADSRAYNLIFAPRVMLFRRRAQLAVERLGPLWTPAVPRRFRHCENITSISAASAAPT
jgi:hypothetical protein